VKLPAISPLQFRLKTLGPFRVPEYKGSLFRGGFGHFFRDLICVTRAPDCKGCPHLATCPYSLIFESPVLPEHAVLRKYPHAPHPFVLVPPLDPRTALPPGVDLCMQVTLIGPGIAYLPHFIRVFDELGASGRYGGRFSISAVTSAFGGRDVVYDGGTRRFLGSPMVWQLPPPNGPVQRLRLHFITPLRMRTGGRYNDSPDFVAVTHALLRRLHLLGALYGGMDGDARWMHSLMAQADAVVTERADFRWYHWERTSGRDRRRIAMDGVVGSLEASGDLTALAPCFRVGEWLHVGSGTSMGMGKYTMDYTS